ncbi:MAG: DUF2330 domain-containing protein [Myxococcota bacterium]
MKRIAIAAVVTTVLVLSSSPAFSFCGFYVAGSEEDLFNDATRVSLMRYGKRTVLSMQNNYMGPPEDFAMVVPVPTVLKKKHVKTLPNNVFERLDALSSPRLVEYWEADPCEKIWRKTRFYDFDDSTIDGSLVRPDGSGTKGNVRVEAQYKVGEYDIVVLSSDASTALESWLRENDYNIPDGAAPYFRPYVQKGQYFFVAKVDIDRVEYEDGRAVLSPLRFFYDSDDFSLPVRLGLINARGAQDLVVFLLAPGQRYEVANFPNVTIPTNIGVNENTKTRFAEFYNALFDQVLKENPQAVVTEYAWSPRKCDPCPQGVGQPLTNKELMLLGVDALPQDQLIRNSGGPSLNWTLTRLHTRYAKTSLGQDLVFRPAPPIQGGRGMPDEDGSLPKTQPQPAVTDSFQARYIIRHSWDGPIDCENPQRGRWGGPPKGAESAGTQAASDLGFSEAEAVGLATFIDEKRAVAGLDKPLESYTDPTEDVVASWGKLVEEPEMPKSPEPEQDTRGGCASSGCGGKDGSGAAIFILLAGMLGTRRLRGSDS